MNKILPSILILTVAFYGVSSFAHANPNTDCDLSIRNTYENNVRTEYNYLATTENAQRCLADAGFYNYKDANGKLKFTGKYWTETENAAKAYLKIGINNDEAKKAEAAKVEADRVAEEERQNLQKKSDDLIAQSQAETQVETQASTINSTSATNNIASASTQSANTTNKSQIAVVGNSTIQDSREPASADKFLINSIYFLFALPFILFAISIIAAFLKVFKKPNE
jgi:hypothetical protein